MSAQEMVLRQNNGWLVASDEPLRTSVPDETERWIAIDEPMEVKR